MNVLAAPFLYTMPSEIEAFWCFSKFIEECCPLYVQPTLEGVHRGLKVRCHAHHFIVLACRHARQLLDRCLKIVDPDLFAHLRSKNLSAELYAFPCWSYFLLRSLLSDHFASPPQPYLRCALVRHHLIKSSNYGTFCSPLVST